MPDQPKDFLTKHCFIDLVVHNEGERTFLEILEKLPQKNFADIKGVSFLDNNGAFSKNERQVRIKDLSEVPSPFLNGMFNEIIRKNPKKNGLGYGKQTAAAHLSAPFVTGVQLQLRLSQTLK